MTHVIEGRSLYFSQFERLERRSAQDPSWLRTLRRDSIDRFDRLGFPTPRDEEWRFTSLTPITSRTFEPADPTLELAADRLAGQALTGSDTVRLVVVNGRVSPALSSLPSEGAFRVEPLARALASHSDLLERHLGRLVPDGDSAFVALNTAFLQDGALVEIPAGTVVQGPIEVIFVTDAPDGPVVTHPRLLILAGPHSQASVVERHLGREGQVYFVNAVTEILAADDAVLNHYRVVLDSNRASHIGSVLVRLGRSSTAASHSITFGGGLVRNDAMAVLGGEGGECTLNGLYLSDGERLVDNHTTIDHAQPHCASHEVYKGVLDGRGRAVFNGKIVVRPQAQKTDAKQTNKALLLSEDAQINTKPQLEIFADDVKCTHGATIGQLDAEALFYLQARGIGRAAARDLLIHAFANDILSRIAIPELREGLEATLFERLRPGSGPREA